MKLRADTACYQHPGRIAGAICGRCHRPICPECMTDQPDGHGQSGWRCLHCLPAGPHRRRTPPAARRRGATATLRTPPLGTMRLTPAVTALIAVNVVVYLATAHDQATIDARFDMLPAAVAAGQWYRLFTAAFLHLSVEHIFFNMATLAIVGPAVEAALGRVRFVALYLLAALGGSVASYLLSPYLTPAVGASGAIFGVLGAYYVLAHRSRVDTRTVLALIGINLVLGFIETGIDWRAHLGGLATGVAVAYAFARAADLRRHRATAGAVATVVVAASALAAIAQLPAGHVNL